MSINKLVFAGIVSVGLLASCAGDESVPNQDTTVKKLSITLKGEAATKAAILTAPTNSDEANMNRVTIGIFDHTTNAVKAIQEFTSAQLAAGSGTDKVATITGNSISVNDSVLVAVNAPSGTFTGVQNISAFKNKSWDISQTNSSGTQSATSLPMFGIGSAVANGSNFTATVTVIHLVSKIALSPIKVDFDANGAYANAKFTPTEVFLYNVPEFAYFSYSPFYYDATTASSGAFFHGSVATLSGLTAAAYLGSGTISSGTTLSGVSGASTATASNPSSLYFYTTPNIGSNSIYNTRLIIKGDFSADGTSTATPVYYPVQINHILSSGGNSYLGDGLDKYVYPNRLYSLDVTIKGKGAISPSTVIDPADVSVTVTVQNFITKSQSVIFN